MQGPFTGLTGEFASLSGQRALIAVDVLGNSVHVEVDLEWVVVTPPTRRSVSSFEGPGFQRRSGI
jgi:hypothetical protein